MATQFASAGPEQVADKVLRRAQVSKMTRALQDRLALANHKIQHSHNPSIESAPLTYPSRKRSYSNNDHFSDTSSSASGQCFSVGIPASSPLSGPIFSDDIRSGSLRGPAKRLRGPPDYAEPSRPRPVNRSRDTRSTHKTWKASYNLPQSSPVRRQHQTLPRPSLRNHHQASFISQTSTIFDSPSASEDDDQDLPLHSFQVFADSTNIPSSPPRTPSPSLSRSATLRGAKSFNLQTETHYTGKDGANALLYLAASPSPAFILDKQSPVVLPSTPPSRSTLFPNTPLPSSMMSPLGNQAFFGFGSTTPNTAFNFADFVNVTPSPAQRRWPNTPSARTPLAGRGRQIMLPSLMSPNLQARPQKKDTGLGMELGGELTR